MVFVLPVLVAMPAPGTVIFQDGFETGLSWHAQVGAYGGWSPPPTSNTQYVSIDTTKRHAGRNSLRILNRTQGGSWVSAAFPSGQNNPADLWFSFWQMIPVGTGFNVEPGAVAPYNNPGIKWMWVEPVSGGGPNGSGNRYFPEPYGTEVTIQNEWKNSGPMCYTGMNMPVDGQWHEYKFHIIRTFGVGAGGFEFWLDDVKSKDACGTKQTTCPDVNNSGVPQTSCQPLQAWMVGTYRNYASLDTQYFYLDDVTLATSDPDLGSAIFLHRETAQGPSIRSLMNVRGILELRIRLEKQAAFSLSVFNATGRKVSGFIRLNVPALDQKVECGGQALFPGGVYVVLVSQEGKSFARQLAYLP